MNSLGHICGEDLQLNQGSLVVVSDVEATKQRLLRRLLTNKGDYLWQQDYGVGLAQVVGAVVEDQRLAAAIRQQVASDIGVDSAKPVDVRIKQNDVGVVLCSISYIDKNNNEIQNLNI